MCFSRQSFCKFCKQFLRVASFSHCKLYSSGNCEKRQVYSKFFEVCESCKLQIATHQPAFIPRFWIQKGPEYQTGFECDYKAQSKDIAVVYNGFHVVVLQRGMQLILTNVYECSSWQMYVVSFFSKKNKSRSVLKDLELYSCCTFT